MNCLQHSRAMRYAVRMENFKRSIDALKQYVKPIGALTEVDRHSNQRQMQLCKARQGHVFSLCARPCLTAACRATCLKKHHDTTVNRFTGRAVLGAWATPDSRMHDQRLLGEELSAIPIIYLNNKRLFLVHRECAACHLAQSVAMELPAPRDV